MVLLIFIVIINIILVFIILPKIKSNNSNLKFTKKNYKKIERLELLKKEYNLFDEAIALKRKGKYEEADKIYTNLMNINGASVVLYMAMAKNLASAQDYNNAITLLKQVISTLGGNEITTKSDYRNFVEMNKGSLNHDACDQLWLALDHLADIEAIKNNKVSLDEKLGYLRAISGNRNYKL